jgi:glycosyltransferase involved in cell wall biosynthesis
MTLTQDSFDYPQTRRVLVFSYAFPPMQIQMSPVVARALAGLKYQGFSVDVLTIKNFLPRIIASDESLMPYVRSCVDNLYYIPLDDTFSLWRSKYLKWTTSDIMGPLEQSALKLLMSMDVEAYSAVMTFSPFHSINNVMLRVKQSNPKIRWIAHFCDPWAGNPLESNRLRQIWNEWYEPKMLATVDFVTNSSKFTLEMMLRKHQNFDRSKACVIPHFFDRELYPKRPKAINQKAKLRFVGTLFGRRTPKPLFEAVLNLLEHRLDLHGRFTIELVGNIEESMLSNETVQSLPEGIIQHIPPVSYLKSLELMYDADILLLIEADTDLNLFVPSKLADYMGADTPIVGIADSGGSRDILDSLGCWTATPNDIANIERVLGNAIDYVLNGCSSPWYNEEFKNSFSLQSVSKQLADLI